MDLDRNDFISQSPQSQDSVREINTSQSQTQSDDEVLSETEFQDYINKYPFAAEPTYFTRPSRYYGPASTWRTWTAEDRAVAGQINTEQATDLSSSLYTTFITKQKARQLAGSRKLRSRSRSRHADTDAERESLVPPEAFTAWPLFADEVPRQQFGNNLPESTASGIQDALIAITLRHAKERWNGRAQAPAEPVVEREKRDWRGEQDLTKQQLRNAGLLNESLDDFKPTAEDESEVEPLTEDQQSDYEEDEPLPEGVQTFSSQAFLNDESSSSDFEVNSVKPDSEDDKPLFSADEDQARRLLLPVARHTLTKLDALLLALHKSRAAYAGQETDSRTSSRARSRSRSNAPVRGRAVENNRAASFADQTEPRGRKRARSSSNESHGISRGRSQLKSQAIHASNSRTRERNSHHRRLAPRDWSDVLGMAALTGWDAASLGRASEQCARLFGENMRFSTFHEAEADSTMPARPAGPWFEDQVAYLSDAEGAATTVDQSEAEDKEITAESQHEPSVTSGTALSDLVCPISTCPQHRHVYGRRTRLYKHISERHQSFDLESFKKAASQNSLRGRYDRSRMRSRNRLKASEETDGSNSEGVDHKNRVT